MEISIGIRGDQTDEISKILCEAFSEKMIPIFGSEKKVLEILSKHVNAERIMTATFDGRVVGVAGLKFEGSGFVSLDLLKAFKKFKFGIFKVAFLGLILEGKQGSGSLLLETLAVEEKSRGRGIGKEILNCVLNYAKMKKFENVRLYVSNRNTKAFTLYERTGFKKMKIHRIPWPWKRIFGFEFFDEMVYVF